MEYSIVSILVESLYNMVVSMYFEKDLEFEFVENHLSRWLEPFEALEDSVCQVFCWMRMDMDGHQPL